MFEIILAYFKTEKTLTEEGSDHATDWGQDKDGGQNVDIRLVQLAQIQQRGALGTVDQTLKWEGPVFLDMS